MLKRLIQMLRDDSISIESINITVKGLIKASLIITYIDRATLLKHRLSLKCPNYSYASDARDKLEAIAIVY